MSVSRIPIPISNTFIEIWEFLLKSNFKRFACNYITFVGLDSFQYLCWQPKKLSNGNETKKKKKTSKYIHNNCFSWTFGIRWEQQCVECVAVVAVDDVDSFVGFEIKHALHAFSKTTLVSKHELNICINGHTVYVLWCGDRERERANESKLLSIRFFILLFPIRVQM